MGRTSSSRLRKDAAKSPIKVASKTPSSSSTPRKAKKYAAAVVTPDVKASKQGKKKQINSKQKSKTSASSLHSCQNSTLFAVFPTYKGMYFNRQTIVELWEMQKHELRRNERCLTLNEHQDRIPEMVEFCLMLWQRQQMQQRMANVSIDILQRYHFCNNYRELDRGTAYFRAQVLELVDGMFGEKNQLTATTVSANTLSYDKQPIRLEYTRQVLAMSYYYRLCNKIESFQDLKNPVGGIPRLGQFDGAFVKYVQSHNSPDATRTFFTCAHLNQGFKKYIEGCQQSTGKIPMIAQQIVDATDNNGKIDRKAICKNLKTLDGVGSFTAWQILCDLEESSCFGPCDEVCGGSDLQNDDFVELGPGAKKGLIKIFGESAAKQNFQSLAIVLRDNFHDLLRLVNKDFPLWKNRPVNLKVIEHALCEFQKFVQIQEGKTAGQRVFHSRSGAMDQRLEKTCPSCTHKDARMVRCDTCHFIACESCRKNGFHFIKPRDKYGYTCCRRCNFLDQLDLR